MTTRCCTKMRETRKRKRTEITQNCFYIFCLVANKTTTQNKKTKTKTARKQSKLTEKKTNVNN